MFHCAAPAAAARARAAHAGGEQVFAEPANAHQHAQVARGGGDDAHIVLGTSLLPPSGSISPSCSARANSFLALQACGISPISSRNSVPPSASLNFKFRRALAVGPGVGASHAENSASSKVSGTAAMLIPWTKQPTGAADRHGSRAPVQPAGAPFTQQQNRAGRLRPRACRLTSAAGGLVPMKLARCIWRGVFLPLANCRRAHRRASSRSRAAGQTADEGLQRGFRVVKQHDADGTDQFAICPSRSGMRLTTKVPALLVSRSISNGLAVVSRTQRIWVLGTDLPPCADRTGRPMRTPGRAGSAGTVHPHRWQVRSTRNMPRLTLETAGTWMPPAQNAGARAAVGCRRKRGHGWMEGGCLLEQQRDGHRQPKGAPALQD